MDWMTTNRSGSAEDPDTAPVGVAMNARLGPQIDHERAVLRELPGHRTADCEETIVTVTSSSGFVLRNVFYSMPSRLLDPLRIFRVRFRHDRSPIRTRRWML